MKFEDANIDWEDPGFDSPKHDDVSSTDNLGFLMVSAEALFMQRMFMATSGYRF
jgi:hypothetical protein